MLKGHYLSLDDPSLRLHYREAGEGEAVLLLHGWPTSAHLWRQIMPELARTHRVIALDLPGFGGSDKPVDASYSFRYYERVLSGFLDALGIDRVNLVVHDLGGPVGLYWAVEHQERLLRLALLNTLVYPRPSWAVVAFVLATYLPGVRGLLASPSGLRFGMRFGVTHKERLDEQVLRGYTDPFVDRDARRALLKAAHSLHVRGFFHIARRLPELRVPVRAIYGREDRILPDVARTMERVARDLPQAQVTALPGCGHFLQEDEPEQVAALLGAFLRAPV